MTSNVKLATDYGTVKMVPVFSSYGTIKKLPCALNFLVSFFYADKRPSPFFYVYPTKTLF